jgi:hypothetical protein
MNNGFLCCFLYVYLIFIYFKLKNTLSFYNLNYVIQYGSTKQGYKLVKQKLMTRMSKKACEEPTTDIRTNKKNSPTQSTTTISHCRMA